MVAFFHPFPVNVHLLLQNFSHCIEHSMPVQKAEVVIFNTFYVPQHYCKELYNCLYLTKTGSAWKRLFSAF